jgi:adenine-specific DNA-methyltransferase
MLDKALYADGRTQTYYTEANGIARLMADLLGDVAGKTVLEPAVGRGILLEHLVGAPARVDAVDVDGEALAITQQTHGGFARAIHADFIALSIGDASAPLGHDYDAVISNPPYGLRLSKELRKRLKAQLGNFYVRESYGLFIKFALERLRVGGRYVFVVPDTFLTSHNHTPLRRFLAGGFIPDHIVLMDSKRFGSVQFGYGNLCIIAGNRGAAATQVKWSDLRNTSIDTAPQAAMTWEDEAAHALTMQIETGWAPPSARNSSDHTLTLGDIAACRTGLYTGDNTSFLGFDPARLKRRANGHPILWDGDVYSGALSAEEKLSGLTAAPFYAPLIRGGHRAPFEETFWAAKWNQAAVTHYKTDKKARFQNATFYFREGIAIPMVTSGRLTASFMANAVFDQGVVGVFPHDRAHLLFLLFYLNSVHASRLLKGAINPSANNSANYIARIPVPNITPAMITACAAHESVLHEVDGDIRRVQINALVDALITTDADN